MKAALTAVALVLLVLVALGCTFVVDVTEHAIQMRFGEPVATLVEAGLHLKWPTDTVVRLDNRLQVLENPGPGQDDKEYLTEDVESGIGKNVVVTTYTCWRIRPDPAAVLRFFETMGDLPSAAARLGDVVVSEVGAALGRHDFTALVSTDPSARRWGEFLDGLRARVAERVGEAYGIEIVDIGIQRINFPDQNRRNVFDRMKAERETIAARYRSEGEEAATGIRARAEQQREEILAAAHEEAEKIRGAADAEAARIYAEAYGADPDFYEFLRTLEAYENTLDEGTTVILSGQSAFLRLLNPSAEELAPRAAPGTGTDAGSGSGGSSSSGGGGLGSSGGQRAGDGSDGDEEP